MIKQEVIDRFLKGVDIRGENECWHWKGRVNKCGVGLFTFEKTVDGKRIVETYFANRISYEYYIGNPVRTRYLDNICESRDCSNPKHLKPRDFDARFWDNTDRSTGCWLWQGTINEETGYGMVTINKKSLLVHRIAYEVYHGEKIPDGLMVLHSCDHKPCICPDHLHLGTNADNAREAAERGLTCKGEKNGNHIYTEKQIREIKEYMRGNEHSLAWISRTLAIPKGTLKDIASGRLWGWLKIDEEPVSDEQVSLLPS